MGKAARMTHLLSPCMRTLCYTQNCDAPAGCSLLAVVTYLWVANLKVHLFRSPSANDAEASAKELNACFTELCTCPMGTISVQRR